MKPITTRDVAEHCGIPHHDVARVLRAVADMGEEKARAILRAANALDRSHSQRISSISVVLKGDEVVITAQSGEDLTLEKGTLEAGGNSLFEEVFNLKPVLHQKKPVS